MHNNIFEIFNATIIEASFKPIVSMLKVMNNKIMERVAMRKEWVTGLKQVITPRIISKIDKEKTKARWLQAMRAANGLNGVTHRVDSFVVDLNARTYTCKAWELSGIPCYHALVVTRDERLNLLKVVHDCYSTDYLRLTYSHILMPINRDDMWAKAPGDRGEWDRVSCWNFKNRN